MTYVIPDSLDFDLGNSRVKYRFGAQRGALESGLESLPELSRVRRIRVASVRSAAADREFALQLRKRFGCECEFAITTKVLAGVTNGYQKPTTLGIDRWLAAVAAYSRVKGAVLVADIGTAATLDFVDPDGAHLGGFIVPGLDLMSRVLLRDTASIELDGSESDAQLEPGRTTDQAVQRGCLLAIVHLLDAELARFQVLTDAKAQLLLCGGAARQVGAMLRGSHDVVPDLVLDGLALALP